MTKLINTDKADEFVDKIHKRYPEKPESKIKTVLYGSLSQQMKQLCMKFDEFKCFVLKENREFQTKTIKYINSELKNVSLNNASGLSDESKKLLITILRNGIYSSDQSSNITALEKTLGCSEEPDDPDEPIVKTYTITNNLTNVTNDNSKATVKNGETYTAILTPNDGYVIESVTVIMNDVDVTNTVYSNGSINIDNVTGNIEIVANAIEEETEAVLPNDGLLDFFDFRNATPTINTQQGLTSYAGSNSGAFYTWSATVGNESDDYGSTCKRGLMYDKNGGTTQSSLGQNTTVITHAYLTDRALAYSKHVQASNINICLGASKPEYVNTSGSTAYMNVGDNDIPVTGLEFPHYVNLAIVTDESNIYFYLNGELVVTRSSSESSTFASWVDKIALQVTNTANGKVTACAVYDKTLSQTEIVEAYEYFKTLEVVA